MAGESLNQFFNSPALPDWIQVSSQGFFIRPGGYWLDPKKRAHTALITHAHADHYVPLHQQVHASAETLLIAEARYKKRSGKEKLPHPFGMPFSLGDTAVTFIHAGHILGSAQLVIKHKNQTLLFSGDIRLEKQLTCHELQFPGEKIDLLICESTFGEKNSHSDPVDSIRESIQQSKLKPLLIGVYPVGKAQEINRLFSEHFPEIKIFVHGDILKYHHIYESQGIFPGHFSPYRRQDAKLEKGKFALLVPARFISGYAGDFHYHKLFASGFNRKSSLPHLDGHLDISGHASANELKEYIERVNPSQVVFWHGYPGDLDDFCLERNIQPYHLNLQKIPTQ